MINFIILSASSNKGKELASETDPKLWSQLDVTVLQWIYGTIIIDLLYTILETDSTAQQTWDRLKSIFQDNKNPRDVYLENQFSHILLDYFPNVSATCQDLKILSDEISNLGASVSNQ